MNETLIEDRQFVKVMVKGGLSKDAAEILSDAFANQREMTESIQQKQADTDNNVAREIAALNNNTAQLNKETAVIRENTAKLELQLEQAETRRAQMETRIVRHQMTGFFALAGLIVSLFTLFAIFK